MKAKKPILRFVALAICTSAVLFVSCATVNHLGEYRFGGTRLAGTMRTPPEPEIDGDYNVTVDMKNPVLTFASVATNLAKANQLEKAEVKMYAALQQVDVPRVIFQETYDRCAVSLASEKVASVSDSDYIFDLEIRSYGLEASSYSTAVRIKIETTARVYATAGRRLIWERRADISDPLSPEVFGLHDVIDTVITTAAIA
ncbi:MAG: hypothetical protein JW852_08780, partial [Spirochaetales bacterium]|nr:hypothetical protein [Spirochaetales bacterium]